MHKPLVTGSHMTYAPRRHSGPITAQRTWGMCWLRVVDRKFVPFTFLLRQGLSGGSVPSAQDRNAACRWKDQIGLT